MTKIDLIWDIDMLLKKEMGSVLYDDPPPFYPWASLRSFWQKNNIFKASSAMSSVQYWNSVGTNQNSMFHMLGNQVTCQ